MSKQPEALPPLEASLSEITKLIEKMEQSEQTLEQSLNDFERGITLIKHCQKILTEAEQKVQMLIQRNGDNQLTSYGNEDEGEDEAT